MFQPSCSLRFEDSENIWSPSRRGTGGSAWLWVVMDEARLCETPKHLGWNSIEPQSDICWPIWPSPHLNNTFLWNSDAGKPCTVPNKASYYTRLWITISPNKDRKIKTAICDSGWLCFSKILHLLTFVFLTIDNHRVTAAFGLSWLRDFGCICLTLKFSGS